MKELSKLPAAELEIMMVIWEADTPVNSDYIMEKLRKSWARSTLLNLLTRLGDRGFLRCHKEGRFNIYESLVKQQDYLQKESRHFLKRMHRNSLTSLVASLYDGHSVSKKDLEELKQFIKEAT
ncbi:MAG: BlaI/MecI/CopY family transcriptional regulator [Peptococcaceae bacterium]|jgi:predicted transcriptional regulator|nr:BlaI/MecI/CopY family transcriptional regulator [Peptococcaceae bacterium]